MDDSLLPVYLKLNRKALMTTRCLNFWAEVCGIDGADVYLVCDWVEDDIATWIPEALRDRVVVPTAPEVVAFLKGRVAPHWVNAGAAQMTTFLDAAARGIDHFWAIDGDDTMFFHEPAQVRERLLAVQRYMVQDAVDAASLDFYQTYYDYWSFGVACFRMEPDYFALLEQAGPEAVAQHFPGADVPWHSAWGFRGPDGTFNAESVAANMTLDWVFSYMRDTGLLKATTFYFDEMFFFHAGMALRIPEFDVSGYTLRGAYHWANGLLWDDPISAKAIKL